MNLSYLFVILLAIIAGYCVWMKTKQSPNPLLEHMGGYGTISGLYFNNQSTRCFKNIYDPIDYPGYCSIIGTVTR